MLYPCISICSSRISTGAPTRTAAGEAAPEGRAADLDARRGDVFGGKAVGGDADDFVSGLAVPQGVAHGPGGDEADAVVFAVIFLMRMPGEHRRHPVFLEQADILLALLHREIGIVHALVDGLPDDRTVQEYEDVAGAAGGGELGLEPRLLRRLEFGRLIQDAVGVKADKSAVVRLEGEPVGTAHGHIMRVLFLAEALHVMVTGDDIYRGLQFGQADAVNGILHGIVGVIDQVARQQDEDGIDGIDGGDGGHHQGIRLAVARRPVEKADLGIAHLDEGEGFEGLAGGREPAAEKEKKEKALHRGRC